MDTWTERDVHRWLENNRLGRIRPVFKDRKIDGIALLDLSSDDLVEMDLKPDQRKLLEDALADLQVPDLTEGSKPKKPVKEVRGPQISSSKPNLSSSGQKNTEPATKQRPIVRNGAPSSDTKRSK